ncbi:ThiF family adenylyltransferase [Bacteroidota bacterium]
MNKLHENHWQSRTELLIGEKNIKQLNKSHVLVAGLGGVGAMAAEQLVRAGIGELTIADSDVVSLSNINRQLPAMHSTLGKNKAEIMAERLTDINPELIVHVVTDYLKDEQLIHLVSQPYDYVLDAIDTLSPKLYLIVKSLENRQRIVSSMGAGAKLDPTKIQVADISGTHTCQLASQLRKRLSKHNIKSGFKAVFSSEERIKESMVHTDEVMNKKTNVGTISYMPAVFGCICASVVIRDLIG